MSAALPFAMDLVGEDKSRFPILVTRVLSARKGIVVLRVEEVGRNNALTERMPTYFDREEQGPVLILTDG